MSAQDAVPGWLADASAEESLAWANERFGERAAIASSFGAEDVVLIDLASRHAPRLGVFTLDTGRLPPETYQAHGGGAPALRHGNGSFFPERARVEALEREKGYFSFRRSIEERKECCAIRKVEPL